MKECKWTHHDVTAYLDHQLSDLKEELLKQHLKTCNHCQQLREEYDELNHLLVQLPREPVPEDLTKNIMSTIQPLANLQKASIEETNQELSWWGFLLRGIPLLVSFSMIGVITWIIYLGQKYTWQETPLLVWQSITQMWNGFWSILHLAGNKFSQFFYTTWDTAFTLPERSTGPLLSKFNLLLTKATAYQKVIELTILAVVAWIIIALITAFISSRICFDHGEERI
ncbi:anti-sigma factor family protein [Desulforamulus aeronauticus]|uniref:Anti-sigma-W factor RsiW n=1 Tax=Desulforamulus aeronauticus DSM 10349 TaxID=1121421 RepID=A0A1M6UWB0_9FIRM|nr:zf-HC2 domain-containing protein [Desulforamulus aeronauticus]SHK73537.1 Putative zinc-finger [Desulforamulus aeronauticus DSM 10349]